MRVTQLVVKKPGGQALDLSALVAFEPQVLLAFGALTELRAAAPALVQAFHGAALLGCSTAGEISQQGVSDGSLVLTALAFEHGCSVRTASTVLESMQDSRAAGERLARALPLPGLRAVLVLGQGVQINGSALLAGLHAVLGTDVIVTGGLAGDGGAFAQTWVLDNAGVGTQGLVCLGLYGAALRISHGSFGGWEPFGPARKVTHSQDNVLYALDGEPALTVYKRYLGEHAKGLPASGLLFPFAMLGKDHNELGLTRTILGVNEADGSLTLAGDVEPQGYVRLMHASTDALVAGAVVAAQAARPKDGNDGLAGGTPPRHTALALLVSCVGRKLVMGGRVEEEVEAVAQVFGPAALLAGFYSNGEMSPLVDGQPCKLHNQTMTITYLTEAPAR